jgi:hypothetical protein
VVAWSARSTRDCNAAQPVPAARLTRPPRGGAAALAIALTAPMAEAHVSGQGFILLLPTHLYVAGGTLAVVASFLLLALVPARAFAAVGRVRWWLAGVPPAAVRDRLSAAASLASTALIALLVAAGVTGSRDPLANPLPLGVWTVWWIGLAGAHALLGDLWAHLNPWTGVHRLLTALPPLRAWREQPPLPYPAIAGHWPAVAFFLAFAWFELVHPAPFDPGILAGAVAAYVLVHLVGVLAFGPACWLGQAEPFTLFFRMIAWMAPMGVAAREGAGPRAVFVTVPSFRLLDRPPLPASAVAFVLLALSSVSFDGFARTFTWLSWLGVNPLDYPGRSALMLANTAGLLGTFGLLALAYAAAVRGARPPGALVLSIAPIAVAYHVAHYLPAFLVDAQYALKAASDPFALGWDLLGTRDLYVIASLLADPAWVTAIWRTQVAIIVAGHVAGVWVAHALALRLAPTPRAALRSELPLMALMVAYTMLGLWLLATPTAG